MHRLTSLLLFTMLVVTAACASGPQASAAHHVGRDPAPVASSVGAEHSPGLATLVGEASSVSHDALGSDSAQSERDVVVLRLALGNAEPTGEISELYEASQSELYACLSPLSPDVEGVVLLRLYIDDHARVGAVTVAWRIEPTEGATHLPDSIEVYADAVECMEAALIDTPVLLAHAGEHEMTLELSVH